MGNDEKIEILKILINNNISFYSIKELSKLRKINYKSAYQAVKKLEEEKIVDVEKKGNTSLCKFNYNFNESVFLAERSRLDDFLNVKGIKTIRQELFKSKFPFIALIFGSYAKGDSNKSDIDILLISEHPEELENNLNWLPLDLHINSITYKEFLEMFSRKSFNIVNETVKNNIILYGIEDYYRFLKDVIR